MGEILLLHHKREPLGKGGESFWLWFARAHSWTESYDFEIMELLFVIFGGGIED
jgi:hypothetical protein